MSQKIAVVQGISSETFNLHKNFMEVAAISLVEKGFHIHAPVMWNESGISISSLEQVKLFGESSFSPESKTFVPIYQDERLVEAIKKSLPLRASLESYKEIHCCSALIGAEVFLTVNQEETGFGAMFKRVAQNYGLPCFNFTSEDGLLAFIEYYKSL